MKNLQLTSRYKKKGSADSDIDLMSYAYIIQLSVSEQYVRQNLKKITGSRSEVVT